VVEAWLAQLTVHLSALRTRAEISRPWCDAAIDWSKRSRSRNWIVVESRGKRTRPIHCVPHETTAGIVNRRPVRSPRILNGLQSPWMRRSTASEISCANQSGIRLPSAAGSIANVDNQPTACGSASACTSQLHHNTRINITGSGVRTPQPTSRSRSSLPGRLSSSLRRRPRPIPVRPAIARCVR